MYHLVFTSHKRHRVGGGASLTDRTCPVISQILRYFSTRPRCSGQILCLKVGLALSNDKIYIPSEYLRR